MSVEEGEKRKEAGIALAAANRSRILAAGKRIARAHPLARSGISADDVYDGLEDEMWDIRHLGPAAGALFRGKEWVFIKKWRKSRRTTNNSRDNRVWILVDLPPST